MIEYQDLIIKSDEFVSIRQSRQHLNAFMLESDDELYLNNFSLMLAKMLMCSSPHAPCGECQDCLKMDLTTHSDLHIYPRFSKTIVVEDVRDLLDKIYLAPLEGDKKIFVLHNFSSATPQAQNKLLKILEECPPNSYIILNVSNVSKVLTTVQSRCQKIRLQPIPNNVLKAVLMPNGTNNIDRVLSVASGNLTKAVRYLSDDSFQKIYDDVLNVIVDMKDSRHVLQYSHPLSSESIGVIFELFEIFFRDLLILKLGKDGLVLDKSCIESLRKVQADYSLDAIDLIIKRIYLVRQQLEFNCNKQAIIDSFLLYILEVKYLCKE